MTLAASIILVLTILTWYITKKLPWKICPICVGVSGTWLVLSAGIIWGLFSADYKLPVAMLMGGTVVGIAFQGEKVWPWAQRNIFYWKVPAIVFGMPLAYFLFIKMSPVALMTEAALLSAVTYLFFINPHTTTRTSVIDAEPKESSFGVGVKPRNPKEHKDTRSVSEIEEKMKNCC